MGTIVIHAGMPKTGSTSIQDWLRDDWMALGRLHGVQPAVLVAEGSEPRLRARAYVGGAITSGLAVKQYRDGTKPRSMMDQMADDLDSLASGDKQVVVTAEHLASLVRRPDENFATALNRLATRHEVKVVLYVRPQHAAVEASWKQFGFRRHDETPSEFVRSTSRMLRYHGTLTRCREAMPEVTLDMRAFVTDLLRDGDVVSDFAQEVLGLDASAVAGQRTRSNPPLPLHVANMLRCAPDELFGESYLGLRRIRRLKRHIDGIEFREPAAIHRSRLVLRQFCFDEHEADNLLLIQAQGWPLDHFVSPPDWEHDADRSGDVAELDELWVPRASGEELDFVFATLQIWLDQPEKPPSRSPSDILSGLRRRLGRVRRRF